MSTAEVVQLLPAAIIASVFMGLVFRWEVQMFRYIKRIFAF